MSLPLATTDGPLTERADAARNRQRIICAAERLFAERGACGVSMDDVALDVSPLHLPHRDPYPGEA